MSRIIKAVTLLELLISIVLFSIVILAIGSIDLFSNWHVISADRRVKVQNEISNALEHMTKEINKAIGNEIIDGMNMVVNQSAIGGDTAVKIFIDANSNGIRETAAGTDYWIAYRFTGNTGSPLTQFQLWHCPECTNAPCTTCNLPWSTSASLVARNIAAFTVTKPSNPLSQNYITVQLNACWDPLTVDLIANPNGTVDNPCVRMDTRIKMPAVSTN